MEKSNFQKFQEARSFTKAELALAILVGLMNKKETLLPSEEKDFKKYLKSQSITVKAVLADPPSDLSAEVEKVREFLKTYSPLD